MRLFLVRHGESVSPDIDPKQPLSKEAVKKLEAFAIALTSCDLKVDAIFHSEKLRAKQTAEVLARIIAPDISVQERTGLKPNDPPDAILNEIIDFDGNLMLVGHLPFLEVMLARLLLCEHSKLFQFRTGSIVCLEKMTNTWSVIWALYPEFFVSF